MKPLKHCGNDKNPVCPPSLVLCKDCLQRLGEKMEAILASFDAKDQKL